MPYQIITWLLNILVLTLGFGQLLRFEFWGVPVYLHDFLVLILLILLTLKAGVSPLPGFPRSIKIFLIGLGLGWLVAVYIFPLPSLIVPSLYTLRLLAYLTFYFRLKTSVYGIKPAYFIISGLTTLAIGYLQYFLLPDMRWAKSLGWDDHLNRLTLPHYDPTFTGIMLALTALYLYLIKKPAFAILFLPALLLTYSRSLWLTLAVIGFAYAVNKRKYAKLGLCLALTLFTIMLLPKGFGEGTNLLRLYSIRERINKDVVLVKAVGWRAVTGIGLNTIPLIKTPGNSNFTDHATSTNNSYLFVLLTTGLLGLIGWATFLKNLYSLSKFKYLLAFYLIAGIFNNVIFYPFALLWIFLLDSSKVPSGS